MATKMRGSPIKGRVKARSGYGVTTRPGATKSRGSNLTRYKPNPKFPTRAVLM